MRTHRRVSSLSFLSAVVVVLAMSGLPARAQFSYSESFKNSTAAGWDFYSSGSGPGARLTSGATPTAFDPEAGKSVIDPTGQGWLRLATTTSNQANAALFDAPIPSAGNAITVKFSVAMWGDNGMENGGDGLTFFMRDASKDASVGAFGGSIGYAQKTGIDGVSGGYFGVAFDVFGNYSAATEGRTGGVGADPNAVAVRGPGQGQTGYNYLAGTGGYNYTTTGSATTRDSGDPTIAALPYSLSSPTATSRPNQATGYRNVEITLSATSALTVKMQFGEDGAWRTLFTADMSSFARPDQLELGFSAGTGDANQVYEIGNNFSVDATGTANTSYWDNGGTSANQNIWRNKTGPSSNWTGNANPATGAIVVFNDAYVSQAQTIDIQGEDKQVSSLYFSGKYGYTINSSASKKLIFSSTTGTSYLSVTNNANGNANNTVNAAVQLANDLVIDNYVNQTLKLGGAVDLGGNTMTVKGPGTTVFGGSITGGGTIVKTDSGIMEFDSTVAATNLTLSGGTILLSSANVAVTTLHVTGNSILDFGTDTGSIFNVTNLIIDAGATLTINNWTSAVDYFYAQNSPGSTNLSRVVFNGFGSAAWQSFDKQIKPVPELSTYGALFMGASVCLVGLVRFRRQRRGVA